MTLTKKQAMIIAGILWFFFFGFIIFMRFIYTQKGILGHEKDRAILYQHIKKQWRKIK